MLFKNANWQLQFKQRVGISGANGVGKSSLLALILGDLSADSGSVSVNNNAVIAHVKQETPAVERQALDYVIDGDSNLRQIESELEKEHPPQLASHYLSEYEIADGYSAKARAAQLLAGLGFSDAQFELPVASFSGGWRMRLNLAQALMCPSNLLLLDEPTNHLDLNAIIWLENYLLRYQGSLLLVSHDRDFLDKTCNHILHIQQQQLTAYRGNYSQFEQVALQKMQQALKNSAKIAQKRAHMEQFVQKFRAKASKAKQAQSRLKALSKLPDQILLQQQQGFDFEFAANLAHAKHLLNISAADFGYSNNSETNLVIENLDFNLNAGDRIGLLGKNGAGKSTFIKTLCGEIPLLAGSCHWHQNSQVAYFAQHQLEQLDARQTPFSYLKAQSELKEPQIYNHLGFFGFDHAHSTTLIEHLSGGEKARLVLAQIVLKKPNVLLLDEPTNHLDLEMRQSLIAALQTFDGAIIVIAHDRFLLGSICEQFYILKDKQLAEYDGDLDDYSKLLQQQSTAEKTAETADKAHSKKAQRQQQAAHRKILQPFLKELKAAEQELERASQTNSELQQKLADSSLYTDPEQQHELQQLLEQQTSAKQQLLQAEQNWLKAQTIVEEKEQQLNNPAQ